MCLVCTCTLIYYGQYTSAIICKETNVGAVAVNSVYFGSDIQTQTNGDNAGVVCQGMYSIILY